VEFVLACHFKYIVAVKFLLSLASVKGDSNTPVISWEQHPDMVAISLTLNRNSVSVDVKNTSKDLVRFINLGSNEFVKLFYTDTSGTLIPLKGPKFYNDKRDDDQSGAISVDVPPNGNITRKIKITSQELTPLKTQPVTCHLIVYDPTTKQRYAIESSPQILTETVETAPGK